MEMNTKWLSLSFQNKILTPATNERADYISAFGTVSEGVNHWHPFTRDSGH